MRRAATVAGVWLLVCAAVMAGAVTAVAEPTKHGGFETYQVVGDAVPEPLGGLTGDGERGKAIVRDRRRGNCLICHGLSIEGELFQGELGPSLDDVGARLSAGQIRLRLIDPGLLNAQALMPAYHKVDGLREVASEYVGKPVLSAQEIEDVVSYLASQVSER